VTRRFLQLLLPCLVALLPLSSHAETAADIYGEDIYWNATPNDVNNLLRNLKDRSDINYSMTVKSLDQVSPDPEKNPVLFRSGHYNFNYSPVERQKLREFMLGGGMVIYDTGLGSAPFYRSVMREMKLIFPEQPVQRLTSDHPIFHSYNDVDRVQYASGVAQAGFKGNEPWFDAVEINCRVVALISRWGMAVGWQDTVKPDDQALMPQSAVKIGENIFAYASAMRAWAKNASSAMKFVDQDKSASGKVAIVQLVYDGVWKTRHAGLSVLLQTFNARTDVPVKFEIKEMRLSNHEIFNSPLLYITGHEDFELPKEEILLLRKYLENGGFVCAEACCGRKGFDASFRRLIAQAMPTRPLKLIPKESTLFNLPHEIKTLGVTPTLAKDLGMSAIPPRLEGVDMDGNLVVVFSPFGMAGGWEMSQSPYARGYNDVGAIKLGQNILMLAVTQ
jgi:hypothetical protein